MISRGRDGLDPQARLDYLDGLRGLASSSVFLLHAGVRVSGLFTEVMVSWFDLGAFGVMTFFLCSGFVIPASLERSGSLPRFWCRRACRLYPLYWFSVIALLACYAGGAVTPANSPWSRVAGGALRSRPVGTVLANLTMFQDFLGFPHLAETYWTLALEMVFYLTVSVVFGAGLMGRLPSITVRFLLAAVAIQAVVLALHLRVLTGNMTAFAMLFVGAVLYRLLRGEVRTGTGVGIVCLASVAIVVSSAGDSVTLQAPWHSVNVLTGRLAAFALFGGVLLLRPVRVPRAAIYLGRISYSLYLVHPLVLVLVPPFHSPALTLIVWSATLIVAASATYNAVERPGIALGRRLTSAWAPSAPRVRSESSRAGFEEGAAVPGAECGPTGYRQKPEKSRGLLDFKADFAPRDPAEEPILS